MKRFIFSMQGILNTRQAQKQIREHQLYQARQNLNLAIEALSAIESRLGETIAYAPATGINCAFLQQREKHIALLKRLHKAQSVKVSAAETEVKASLTRLRDADIELKKIEKIEQKERALRHIEIKREEQKINDEIGASQAFFRLRQN